MNTPIKPVWLSPHVVALRWGVHKRTVLRAIASGQLPALRVNGRVLRVSETDAAMFYARSCVTCASCVQTKRDAA
ncbi:excisionase family DNA-binding protein [Nibricoccus aquaticus]|uniref:excisionase family DNA-binding protein n=1 Tax=Nibricoccus aquaticus TaxID=2576891 RepID=UPI0010FE9508|nr:excisionase family DNA-binding protein [Nibricoccus aquaticus]